MSAKKELMCLIKFAILCVYASENFPCVGTCAVGEWYQVVLVSLCKTDEVFRSSDWNYRCYYLWWIPCKTEWKHTYSVIVGQMCGHYFITQLQHSKISPLPLSKRSGWCWSRCLCGADIISWVFSCCQVTACFSWVLLCSLWIYAVKIMKKILLVGVLCVSDAGRWDEPAASVQTPLCVLKCFKLAQRESGCQRRWVRNFFWGKRGEQTNLEGCVLHEKGNEEYTKWAKEMMGTCSSCVMVLINNKYLR